MLPSDFSVVVIVVVLVVISFSELVRNLMQDRIEGRSLGAPLLELGREHSLEDDGGGDGGAGAFAASPLSPVPLLQRHAREHPAREQVLLAGGTHADADQEG